MPSLFDTPSLDRALSLPLDPTLRRLLRQRVDHVMALDFTVPEASYFMVVEAGSTDADIADELGFSLLEHDGRRFGEAGFNPIHEYIADVGGFAEVVISASNEATYSILIELSGDADPNLTAFCHTYLD